jgi:hypothetical protein
MRSVALLLLLWASAHADSLLLRNGTRVTGRWWATDAKVLSFLVNGRLQQYSQSEVVEVVFGVEPSADSVPAGAAPVSPASPASTNPPPPSAALGLTQPVQIGAVYFQDSSDNLIPLEPAEGSGHRATAGRDGNRSRNGASGQYWDMPGARSPVRLKSDSRLLFVVEMPGGIDPSAFSLYPLETKGNTRRTMAGTSGGAPKTIPLTTRRLTGNTYALTPVGGVAPGEYSFSPSNSNDAYCFGVDPGGAVAR